MDELPVLVVEDEVMVLALIEDALKDAGFGLPTSDSAERAIEALERPGAEFVALVTDIRLVGRLTGWDVARRARELNSALAIVYITGDAGSEWASEGVPNSVLIQKPFAPAQVVTAVSQLLNVEGPR